MDFAAQGVDLAGRRQVGLQLEGLADGADARALAIGAAGIEQQLERQVALHGAGGVLAAVRQQLELLADIAEETLELE